MATESPPAFGALLRFYRRQTGLSLQALAEQAGLSLRGVSDLERGVRRHPYPDTVQRLADALGLAAPDRTRFVAAAQPAVVAPRPLSAASLPTNLPVPLTSFIGREQELTELTHRLGTTRLLTLTGAGGVGKTRLGFEVARAVQTKHRDGVWLVELAALADPDLVPRAVAQALSVREIPGQDTLDTLLAFLTTRHLLLVIDNCEHLIEPVAQLVETMLHGCPHVQILATSREALRIPGEANWRVPSLAIPPADRTPPLDQLTGYAAVQLFVERAAAVRPTFALALEHPSAVAQICQRLDGIPLAIELAAARVEGLSAEQIAARLDQRFRLLTEGSRTALPRQQTLRATVEWSYHLLDDLEQTVFNRLTVFAGGFTSEAAEAVCNGPDIPPDEVLGQLLRLLAKSLVVAEGTAGEVRYRLLETLRAYGLERLEASGEAAARRRQHATFYVDLVEQAEPHLTGANQQIWLQRLQAEMGNLRQALAWCLEHDPEEGLRLLGSAANFWEIIDHIVDGQRWLDAMLARTTERTAARGNALRAVGHYAALQRDLPTARRRLEESLAILRELGDQRGVALTRRVLGFVAVWEGNPQAARDLYAESLALFRRAGDQWGVGMSLRDLGFLAQSAGNNARAKPLYDECVAVLRDAGDTVGAAMGLWHLGHIALDEADYAQARAIFEEARTLFHQAGNRFYTPLVMTAQGVLARIEGDDTRALSLLTEALAGWQDGQSVAWGALTLIQVGAVALRHGDHVEAWRRARDSLDLVRETRLARSIAPALYFAGLVALHCDAAGQGVQLIAAARAAVPDLFTDFPISRWFRDVLADGDSQLARARTMLGEAAFEVATATGQAMPLEQAIAAALAHHQAA